MATLRFHIVPNAKRDEVTGEHSETIKIKLHASVQWKEERTPLCTVSWPRN
jgi:hypothetical protein